MLKKLSLAAIIGMIGVTTASANAVNINLKNLLLQQGNINYSVMTYGAKLNYTGDTNKKNGLVGGVYASMYDNQTFTTPYKIEIDGEKTKVKYKDSTPNLTQSDLTLIYHSYLLKNFDLSAGLHYIDSTDILTTSGKIYKLGILYYKTLDYNFGGNLYYSDYSNYKTSPKISQLTLKAGKTLGQFYLSFNFKYIKPLKNREENNLKKSYSSGGININYFRKDFSMEVGGWIGKKAFAIDNDGFVVNNLSSLQKNAYHIKTNFNITKTQKLSIGYSKTTFENINKKNAYTNAYTLAYLMNF